jgi:hypothetical protein
MQTTLNRGPDWPQQQVKLDIEFAEETLLKLGAVKPIFAIHNATGTLVIGTGWANDEDKERIAAFLRILCIAEDAIAVSFMAEAWMRATDRRPEESEDDAIARARRSVSPREVIVAEVIWRDLDGVLHLLSEEREIERDADGRPSGATPLPKFDAARSESRWADLLPPRSPTEAEKRAARVVLAELKKVMAIDVKGRA